MNTSKKIFVIALLIIGTTFGFVACKKGNKDPFISFKSREGRLTGKWQVTGWTVNEKDQLSRTDTATVMNAGCPNQTATTITTHEIFLTFDKSGEYEWRDKATAVTSFALWHAGAAACVAGAGITVDSVQMMEGIWMFGGGVGNFKNKEELVLTDLYHIDGTIWDLIELKSKEMIFETDVTDQSTQAVTKTVMTLTHVKD